MKFARPLLFGIAAIAAVMLIGVGLLLNSSVQTWVVRRALAARPDLHTTVGRVSAGFGHLTITDVQVFRDGWSVKAPRVDADLSVTAAVLRRRFTVAKLTATDWVFALASPTAPRATPPPGPAAAAPAQVPAVFRGIFGSLVLPADVSVGSLELAGEIRREDSVTRLRVVGGDLAPGRDGKFTIIADTVLSHEDVGTVRAEGQLTVQMDTSRTFRQFALATKLTAAGGKLDLPVTVRTDATASRVSTGERYALRAFSGDRPLANVTAELVNGTSKLTGDWKVDLRDADVAPFTLGHRIPMFVVAGTGTLETDSDLASLHAIGRLDATVDNLVVVSPRLSGVGGVKLTADVDLAHLAGVFAVAKCDVLLAGVDSSVGTAPARNEVATVKALQPFEFNPRTGELKAADETHDLLGVVLHGVPLSWAKPFLPDLAIEGDRVRGELTATPRAGGLTFRTTVPLAITHLSIAQPNRAFIRDVDVSARVSGDYTPRGWQAEAAGVTVRSGGRNLLLLDGKAGQLAGADQPVNATGLLTLDLATVLDQPVFRGLLAVKGGEATLDFAASVGKTKELQTVISVRNLASTTAVSGGPLPALTAKVRADVAADGRIAFNAPIALQRAGRASDVTVVGSVAGHRFEGQLTSTNFVVDDATVLAALLPPKPNGAPAEPPLWAAWNGTIALQLKRLACPGGVQMSNVAGTLRLTDGTVAFDGIEAVLGETGVARATGTIGFEAGSADPFSLGGEFLLKDFDPGPVFSVLNPRQPPTLEGHFAITSQVTARASRLSLLTQAAMGNFEVTSRSGVFRGLSVNVGNLVETSSRLRAWLAAAGDVITSPFMGAKDQDEITSRSQAANELAKILSNIAYDQLNVVIARHDDAVATVKEFTLISPDLRIDGSGLARRGAGRSPFHGVVDLELHLHARGRPAELMKYLGILDAKPDDLGYASCTLPVHLEGPIDRPDTTQLSNRLVALGMAKPGLTEKAVDWINRLRGKSTN